MPISVPVNCPLCPGELSISVDIKLESHARELSADGQHATINVSAEVSDEGRECITEHLRVAHPEVKLNRTPTWLKRLRGYPRPPVSGR